MKILSIINMNIPVELPSGKILNIARFIALLPVATTTDSGYDLILEGYSNPINLELKDADAIKKLLKLDPNILFKDQTSSFNIEEQLHQNQPAIALLAKRIQRHKNMSIPESIEREKLFDEFKQKMDYERLLDQKLYSHS